MLVFFSLQTDVWWQYLNKHGKKKKIDFSTQQTYGEEDICHKHAAYLEIVVSISSLAFLPASSKNLVMVNPAPIYMVILIGTQFRGTNPDAFQHTQSKKFGMDCNTENKQ